MRVALADQRAHRRVARVDGERALGAAGPQEDRRGQPAVARLVHRRVLGEQQPLLLKGLRHLRLGVLERFPTETWPLRSRSAASSLNASTKNSGNCVSFRSPPVLVAVTTTRPGAAIAGRNAPLELVVLTNATRCADSLPSSFAQSATVRSGPGRLNAACVPLKLPWPISRTTTLVVRLARARRGRRTPWSTPSRVAWLVGEKRDVGVGDGVLLLRGVDEARRPLLKLLRVLLVARHAGDDEQMGLLRNRAPQRTQHEDTRPQTTIERRAAPSSQSEESSLRCSARPLRC